MNRLIFILFFLLISGTAIVFASDVNQSAREIYRSILSPYCPGRALSDCPSSAASDLKHRIAQDLENGKSKDEVLSALFKEFGDGIRAAPNAQGFGAMAWIIPPLFFFIGGAFIFFWLSSKKGEGIPQENDQINFN